MRLSLLVFTAALALGTLVLPASSKRPKPVPCPSGRFVLPAGAAALIPGAPSVDRDVVILDESGTPSRLGIASGCALAPGVVKALKKGTMLTGKWPACGTAANVKLAARIDGTCTTLTGALKAKKQKKRVFTATRSTCGDGFVDAGAGEQCEAAADCAGLPCDACRCPGTGTTTTAPTGTASTATTTTAGGSTSTTAGASTTTTLPTVPPPDPSTVAPPLTLGTGTDFAGSNAFLFGPGGPQVNVTPGAIATARIAVLRGRVLDTAAAPLSGVLISIVGHPEFGQTLSRADGMFDLAVNGGAQLLASYKKTGYVEVQRAAMPAFNDWDLMPDVVMTALDSHVTSVTLTGATGMQVHQGGQVTDGDGTRRATVLFPAGTTADLVLPNGSTQPIGTLHVRATEVTVGATGPAAMPGELPLSSGYTYAVELSVDEAIAAGATQVRFNSPVPVYVDDFLGFPVGTTVPVGVYDRQDGMWEALDNGRVIKVLGTTGGLADLDLDGDGNADGAPALTALGITDAERQQLATLYPAAHVLWRALLPHFSACDMNWPKPCGGQCSYPNDPDLRKRRKPDDHARRHPCIDKGSVLSCESQTIGEKVAVAGTPFTLRYSSAHAPGRKVHILVPLTDANPPGDLSHVHATVDIAGQHFAVEEPAAPNLTFDVVWDGKDAYGRPFRSAPIVTGNLGWEYASQYGSATEVQVFARAVPNGNSLAVSGRSRLVLGVNFAFTLGTAGPYAQDRSLGGWSLDVNHRYDPLSHTVFLGDGTEIPAPGNLPVTVLGTGQNGFSAIPAAGAAATSIAFVPNEIQPAEDGGFFATAETGSADGYLSKVGTDGVVRPLFCHGGGCVAPADGVAANTAAFRMSQIRTGPDGALYGRGLDAGVWRVDLDGTLHRVAGGGADTPADGLDARTVGTNAGRIAPTFDGSVWFWERNTRRLWRVTPAGRLAVAAGTGANASAFTGDGGFAGAAAFPEPIDLVADHDGNVFLSIQDSSQGMVLRIRPDGRIERFAGGGCGPSSPTTPDGVARLSACLQFDVSGTLDVGPDGALYGTMGPKNRIYRYGDVVTGVTGAVSADPLLGFPPGVVFGESSSAFAFSRRGPLLAGTSSSAFSGVRSIETAPPTLADGSVLVPVDGGSAVAVFDAKGRHLATRDRFTGAVIYQFGYDAAGALTTITDAGGNVTTIQHDGNGAPTAIVAPGGQTTTLAVDANGFLHTIADPGGHTITLGYAGVADGTVADSGLLKTFMLPSGATSTFAYDTDGNLVSDTNPLGGTTTLARTSLTTGFQITTTSPTGEATVRSIFTNGDGTVERHVVGPAGGETVDKLTPDGVSTITYDDGTVSTVQTVPDPRFGLYLPLAGSTTVKKGNQQNTATNTRVVTTAGSAWVGVDVLTDTLTRAGASWTAVFDRVQRTVTRTSPAGRVRTATVDVAGRPTQVALDAGYAPTTLSWNPKGLLGQLALGVQHRTYAYDAHDRLASLTDAASRAHAYTFDAADRPATITFPDAAVTSLTWDADANLAGFTPPGGGAHAFAYDGDGHETSYTPPTNAAYQRHYRSDGSLQTVTLPGGRQRSYGVDAGGRPTGVTYPEATVAFTYTGTSTFPTTVSRTPTAGTAHTLTYTYRTDLPTSVAASGAATGTYTYTYDTNFLPSLVSLSSGVDTAAFAIQRDADYLVTKFGALNFTRNGPDGAVSAISDGTSTLALGYSNEAQVSSRTLTANAQAAYAVTITRDLSGLPTARTESVGGTSIAWVYTYDARGRLTNVTRNGAQVEAYTYDANGNRLTAAYDGGAATAATYDTQDRLLTRGAVTYGFDADGALATRGSDTFTYSAAGELVSATVGATTVTYDYDGLHRLVRRTQGAAVTEYLYGDLGDPFRITAYRAPSGTLTTLLYDEGGLLVAFQRNGQRFFVGADQVGSPRVITNAAGTTLRVVEYDAFGRTRSDTAPSFDLPIGYAGGLADPVTGLVHFGLRDYDPATGRWTARDPIRLGGHDFNFYAYVGSSPVGFRDPFGLWCVGGSAFELVGITAQVCHTKDGTAVCGGFGFGTSGLGLEGSLSGGLPDDYNGFAANAGVRVRGLGTLALDGSFGQYGDPYDPSVQPCFKSSGTLKGTYRRTEYDLFHLNQGGTRQVDLPDGEDPEPVSLEAKAIWKSCRRY